MLLHFAQSNLIGHLHTLHCFNMQPSHTNAKSCSECLPQPCTCNEQVFTCMTCSTALQCSACSDGRMQQLQSSLPGMWLAAKAAVLCKLSSIQTDPSVCTCGLNPRSQGLFCQCELECSSKCASPECHRLLRTCHSHWPPLW